MQIKEIFKLSIKMRTKETINRNSAFINSFNTFNTYILEIQPSINSSTHSQPSINSSTHSTHIFTNNRNY